MVQLLYVSGNLFDLQPEETEIRQKSDFIRNDIRTYVYISVNVM